jgi:hypothetical protein
MVKSDKIFLIFADIFISKLQKAFMLATGDLDKLRLKGIDVAAFEKQLGNFATGFPPVSLVRAATAGDGILFFQPSEKTALRKYFEQNSTAWSIVKFVPASGAATRMFKPLFDFREQCRDKSFLNLEALRIQGFHTVYDFFSRIEKFAFYSDLEKVFAGEQKELKTLLNNGEFATIIDHLLFEPGLNYSSLPKALLKFHRYPDGSRVAMEEHIVEAAIYARNENSIAKLHFTISPEHLQKFNNRIAEVRSKYEDQFHIRIEITHSVQKPSTDTIAVDMNNVPLRDKNGDLLFRPAGHGALIENLQDIEADIIFIKNIDNVVPDAIKEPTYEYKKVLGGYLLKAREKVFTFLEKTEKQSVSEEEIDEMAVFAREKLCLCLPVEFNLFSPGKKLKLLTQRLDRPIRVCGMVKNEGEPGGGPFWVKDIKGEVSLQIVESSQIDLGSEKQKEIFTSSTHFNPVDIVCSIKNHHGNTFKLSDYVDESTGFISMKSSGGVNLKALELPGLWNGAMADWITIFIEVPVITFNPVKIINDLLRKEHQS